MIRTPVLYVDETLIAIDKPSGLIVHRGWANDDEVAVDVAAELSGGKVYPVHRLDRGTSGVLLFARSSEVARRVHEAFESGQVGKRYVALVRGVPPAEGLIDHPIPRREEGPRVPAVTSFRRLESVEPPGIGRALSLVEAMPETGRLHQVRRHLKHLSSPVVGDANYGQGALNRAVRELFGLARLALHASSVTLRHPVSGEQMMIEAPLPMDLSEPLERMGFAASLPSPA